MGDPEREGLPSEEQKTEEGELRETLESRIDEAQQVDIDLYQVAEVIYNARVEQLKQEGWIRRVEDITDEWELDDHFDDLKRIYQEVCGVMGLAWPPPIRKS